MFNASGFGLFRTDAPRLTMLPDVLESVRSDSGGGVGGNTLRLRGGSDCCLLLDSPGLTRLAAAYEMFSGGLSSLPSDLMVLACTMLAPNRLQRQEVLTRFISEPANPVNVFAESDAATSRALPK